jgi:multiple sugar transport system ATP-binding protein
VVANGCLAVSQLPGKSGLFLLNLKGRSDMANVHFKEVYKVFGKDVVAVNDFSLEIADKEFVVLVGPSGCGKSTTLRMVAGLEEISRGELFIDARIVNDVPPKDRDIAMVFQNYALYPHMSVFDNMAFGLKLRKVSKPEIAQRVGDAADILGITALLARKPKALSGGQRQRVALGRAIVRNPRVFLFDEPLSNLDAKLRVQTRTEIAKLHRRLETTMVYVTHDQVEAMTMGDRIVVMKDGNIMQTDTPLNLYNNPRNKFVAGFIGSPAMNFIEGRIEQDDGIWFVCDGTRLKIPPATASQLHKTLGRTVTFGIRPEDIYAEAEVRQLQDYSKLVAMLEVVEPMGNENFLYLSFGQTQIVARVAPTVLAAVGASTGLIFDMSKAHFFDADTASSLLSR